MSKLSRSFISLILIIVLSIPATLATSVLPVFGYSDSDISSAGPSENDENKQDPADGEASEEEDPPGDSTDPSSDNTDPPKTDIAKPANDFRIFIKSCGINYNVTGKTFYLLSGRSVNMNVSATTSKPFQSIRFASRNRKVATVTSRGKITALKKGSSVIDVTSKGPDGQIIKKTVTIKVIDSSFRKTSRYHGPDKWKKAIAKILKRHKTTQQGRVLFIGSSSIRMWTSLQKDMKKLSVINQGFGGSTVNDSLYYADQLIIPYAPKAIVFYAGTNDIAFGYSPGMVYSRTKEFFKYIHNRLPDTEIYYIAQTRQPKRARFWNKMQKLNAKVKAYAGKDPLVTYIDTTSTVSNISKSKRSQYFLRDGLHFNKKGYKAWSAKIRQVLYRELLQSK